jgi:hypothetical protein
LVETVGSLQVELAPKGVKETGEAAEKVIKQTKEGEKSSKGWGIAHLAAVAGVIKSSPIAQSYMAELSAITGMFADIILTQLMPVLDPFMEFLWEGAEAFENLGPQMKKVIAGVVGIAVAMYVLSAHPIIGAIVLIALGLALLEKKFGAVTIMGRGLVAIFNAITGAVKTLLHWLIGGSLIPVLEMLGSVVKLAVMPYILAFKLGVEGVTKAVEVGGAIVQKTFTMINNFTFGGIMGALEGVTTAAEKLGGVANKVKGWLSF